MVRKFQKGTFYARVRFDRRQEWEWRIPEFSVTLRIRRSALEELRNSSVTALGSILQRGRETGGVLLGSFKPGLLQITGIRELPMREEYGPAYHLDEGEPAQLFSQPESESGTPLSFWRSNLRDQAMPDAHDTDIAAAAAVPNVVLLVEPKPGGEARLICCVRDTNGAWFVSEPSAPILPDPETDRRLLQQLTGDLQEAAVPKKEPGNVLWWVGAALVAVLLAVVSMAVSSRRASAAPENAYVDLGLHIEPAGAGLRLRWNRAIPAVASAVGGNLRIQDGTLERNVILDGRQTQSGMIVYMPESDDIEFRLEVYGDHSRYLGENTRVILARRPQPSDVGAAARAASGNSN